MLIGILQHGSCVVQPTKQAFPSEELIEMVHGCGMNRLNLFGSFLGMHLRKSRTDPKLLHSLSLLDEVLFTGLAPPREEEDWAYKNGIKIRVRNWLLLCLIASC